MAWGGGGDGGRGVSGWKLNDEFRVPWPAVPVPGPLPRTQFIAVTERRLVRLGHLILL